MMCRLLGVTRAGFYAWQDRRPSKRIVEDQQLEALIRQAFERSRRTYGRPRITAELRELKLQVGQRRVGRLMRRAGLWARPRRRFVCTTDSEHSHRHAPNVLQRRFTADAPNKIWAGDITYLPTRQGWLYRAVVIDLFSRKVVGWRTRAALDPVLTVDAMKMALEMRRPSSGLLHHSDRGVQYACDEYQALLSKHRVQPSMSRKGNCWDNAVVESFFSTLKTELVRDQVFVDRAQAQIRVFDYIEAFYNRRRRHSSLAFRSPDEYERARNLSTRP